ncbi:MAG: hypothetical protein COB81_11295 [Flavobacteriaceae bacterium]|nr:MAG: hypothetical protein COB81_11295 [Flavobacteriaceae bacterium]
MQLSIKWILLCSFCAVFSLSYGQLINDNDVFMRDKFTLFKKLTTTKNLVENIVQVGSDNNIQVYNLSAKIKIHQFGNSNSMEFFSYYGRENVSFNVAQIGIHNSIQVIGNNSLSDRIKIYQKGNYSSLIIWNQ